MHSPPPTPKTNNDPPGANNDNDSAPCHQPPEPDELQEAMAKVESSAGKLPPANAHRNLRFCLFVALITILGLGVSLALVALASQDFFRYPATWIVGLILALAVRQAMPLLWKRIEAQQGRQHSE